MTIRKRSLVIAVLLVFALVAYTVAKHYSTPLVLYVVEHALMQKAPPGIDSASLHDRFHAKITSAPDERSRMQSLLRVSEQLEKVQYLTLEQINELLAVDKVEPPKSSGFLPEVSKGDGEKIGVRRAF